MAYQRNQPPLHVAHDIDHASIDYSPRLTMMYLYCPFPLYHRLHIVLYFPFLS